MIKHTFIYFHFCAYYKYLMHTCTHAFMLDACNKFKQTQDLKLHIQAHFPTTIIFLSTILYQVWCVGEAGLPLLAVVCMDNERVYRWWSTLLKRTQVRGRMMNGPWCDDSSAVVVGLCFTDWVDVLVLSLPRTLFRYDNAHIPMHLR